MSKLTSEERNKLPDSAFGDVRNRKYPVLDQSDLDAAARLIGRAPETEQPAIRKRLTAIAKRLGLTLPQSWEKAADDAIEHKSISFEVKALGDENGYGSFTGIGGAFHNIDSVMDIIAPGAFADTLPEFLKNGFVGGLNHDWNVPIGHPAEAVETPEGLYIKAVFDNTPEAQSVRARMTPHPETGRATIGRLSIGYRTEKAQPLDDADAINAYWTKSGYIPSETDLARAQKGPVRLITKMSLIEVSPVLNPANTLARTTGVKSAEPAGFAETSRKVASIARESTEEFGAFVTLAARRAEVRLKEGRQLSESNRRAMQDVLDQHRELVGQHSALCDQLAGVLDRTMPPGKSAPPGPEVAASAIDHDAINQQIIATFAYLDGYA